MIARHGAGLAELGRRHSPSTPVPTCGDWRLADLVWHLAEVQDFWCHVIGNRPAGPDSYDRPSRPADDELGDLLADRCRRLVSLLTDADPAEHAWSWADEQTVGFTVRRQSHEALVHHVDGLLAVGEPVPTVDPALGADGVDELVGVMLTGVPPWATFTRGTGTIRLDAGGAGRSWSLRFGRMTGTSPTTGTDHDLAALERIDDLDRADTVIEAPALDLDLWMWGRLPDEHVSVAGDPDAVARLRQTIAESTQ
ncbi:MAG: maleylpyruvate isomerase N-terminal domain-containing protein [Ilumatobacter sp.]|uniref:maleylpyruvate isomerase N-terminal domain-containing protein n=1 Tax=Ilumatobacter sp. TaxID=1967498 RepID=UPI00261AFBB5|nr:maleylpyruvate isomerase N-terminal domain-containing protein [Ilumatobacter sp.]MDJ0769392.1 maleylpyruvate isomerase N-terminal domain-containing protein [Ilumatobacter sp.]